MIARTSKNTDMLAKLYRSLICRIRGHRFASSRTRPGHTCVRCRYYQEG